MLKSKMIIKYIFLACILYALFALIISTFAFAFPKELSFEDKKAIQHRIKSFELGKPKEDGPDKVTLIESTDEALNVRFAMLDAAQQTIDISYYTAQENESSDAFWGAVLNAANRGVKVRIIMDGKTLKREKKTESNLKILQAHPQIEVKLYNQLHPLKPWKWHSLLHGKYIVVDETFFLMGGRNLGDRYFPTNKETKDIVNDRDVFVWNTDPTRFEESVLSEIVPYIASFWQCKENKDIAKADAAESLINELIQSKNNFSKKYPQFDKVNFESFKNRSLATKQVHLLSGETAARTKKPEIAYAMSQISEQAEKSVRIQTPYATGNNHLLASMDRTAHAVPTTFLINSMATTPNFPAFSNYFYNREKFVETDATILEYQAYDNSIHAKSIRVDDGVSLVGSVNMDDRSFYVNTELMLLIESIPFAKDLDAAIDVYINQSVRVTKDNVYDEHTQVEVISVSNTKKIGMWIVSLFSRLFQFLI